MILLLSALAATNPVDASVTEAARALSLGRPEQARTMIGVAVSRGASGRQVDRLLADLACAENRWAEASARYAALIAAGEPDPYLLEQAGIAAIELGDLALAVHYLDRAVVQVGASWRAHNARAVVADRRLDWPMADRSYAAGLALAPGNATLLNNLGWSMLLRGRWEEAVEPLARASALVPGNARVTGNLDLARAAASERLPRRRPGEGNMAYATRLNDAGVIALRQGYKAKAAAAFARALEASDRWYARAANNLEIAGRN